MPERRSLRSRFRDSGVSEQSALRRGMCLHVLKEAHTDVDRGLLIIVRIFIAGCGRTVVDGRRPERVDGR